MAVNFIYSVRFSLWCLAAEFLLVTVSLLHRFLFCLVEVSP